MNSTNISIALAAPLSAPVVNFDSTIDDYYTLMEADWMKLNSNPEIKNNKMLISFGSGARDLLMPSGLTASQDCDVNVLVSFLFLFSFYFYQLVTFQAYPNPGNVPKCICLK